MAPDGQESNPAEVNASEPEPGDLSEGGPLGPLPRLDRREVRLRSRLDRLASEKALLQSLAWLESAQGASLAVSRADLFWRGAGLLRPGLVAQFTWPSRRTRLGLGIETALGHAIVDRLLGYERNDAETRRQLTPVEWGILTFVIVRSLEQLTRSGSQLGLDDLVLDRVGPERFAAENLARLVTLRWPVRVGPVAGAVRVWIPAAPLEGWLTSAPLGGLTAPLPGSVPSYADLDSVWRAEAGVVTMPRGIARLRVGGVLPIDGSALRGSPQSPTGSIRLALDPAAGTGRNWFGAEAVPLLGAGTLKLTSRLQTDSTPREALSVNASSEPAQAPSPAPADIHVTLIVELGRVNLTLARLADLRPGDVIELGRHSREPVELTSAGRLVARGELVQIDTELGVRVTHIFL